MIARTWIIIGATSIIAEQFAQHAAAAGHNIRLVGRDKEQLTIIAQDIRLRFKVGCDLIIMDMTQPAEQLLTIFASPVSEFDLFIGHSDFSDNDQLNPTAIDRLITVNIYATTLLINHYLNSVQSQHHLVYLSSVAACRGRAKNSLYGASKAAIEVYLNGIQQSASKTQQITIVRLGFIDTKQTYGLPGIFYAPSPNECAAACWRAIHRKKRMVYYPRFWRIIMTVIVYLPFFIFKRMNH